MQNLLELEQRLGFPLFAKPIDGARSLGLIKIEGHEELIDLYSENSNLVVQEFLPDDEGEYTSGCIVIEGKCSSIVTLRRDLRDGNTYRTYRNESTSKYDDIIRSIAECLKPDGPVNFQFRILNGKPIVFEINGRFSGTTPIRYLYGINEVDIILNHYLFNIKTVLPKLKNGVVMRAWSDVFVENEELERLADANFLVKPEAKFYPFNLYDQKNEIK